MLLASIVAKRDRGTIMFESATMEIVGEIPDEPHYWEPICEAAMTALVEAGVVPPIKKDI